MLFLKSPSLKTEKKKKILCKVLPQWRERNRMFKENFFISFYEGKFTFKVCALVLYVCITNVFLPEWWRLLPIPHLPPQPPLNHWFMLCITWHQLASFHGSKLGVGGSQLLATSNIQKRKNVFQRIFIQVL